MSAAETTRVRMLRSIAKQAGRDWLAFNAGEAYDVPVDVAARWIEIGAAAPEEGR